MSIMQWCESLEMTALGVWVRESLYGFPIVVAIHILGLTLSVGMVVWFDLRLLGLSMRRCPVSDVYRRIFPWMLSGMLVMATTGVVLFIAFATKAYPNTFFRIKLASIGLAGVNALYFHLTTERSITRWNDATRPPAAARFAGFASIALWTAVIMAGRMMSYTMF